MKPSDDFKKTIEAYIKQQAATDPLFAPCLEKEGKNIDDCCTYIMNCAKKLADESKGKAVGMTDAEVFGQAIHYYQEDNIEVDLLKMKVAQCRGKCNQPSEYHDQIMQLMSANLPKIAKIAHQTATV